MKPCTDCGAAKSLENFAVKPNYNKTDAVYRNSICRECMSLRMKKWREKNKAFISDAIDGGWTPEEDTKVRQSDKGAKEYAI